MITIMKQSIILGCFWGIFWGVFAFAAFAEDAPVAVRQAAEQGLPSFLQAIPARDLAHFNFSNQAELKQATLGEPFLIYTIPPEFILNYQTDTPLEDMIAPTSIWCFPVLVNGESRTLLMVDLMEGVWKAVGIGSSGIAKQWASVNRVKYSAEGYTTRFVRIFQATADFVVLSHRTAESKMIPLEAARMTLELDRIGEAYAPSEVIPGLQQTVRENLEASKSFK